MSWQGALVTWSVISGVALLAIVPAFTRPKRRNKRKGLPAPRPDERNSIEQFKRIVQ